MNITTIKNGARRSLLVAAAFAVTAGTVAGVLAQANAITAPRPQVSFTFDDGLDSALTLAAPVMDKYKITGTDYIISSCVGMKAGTPQDTCPADEAKSYMTWDQIKTLRDQYHWEIGSHTETHPLLDPNDATVTTHLTAAQITEELKGSQTAIANGTGQSPTAFAAPYGSYDATGQQVIAEAAKYYTSFRGFADYGYNYFPYNNYLIKDIPLQDGAPLRGETTKTDPVVRAKAYIDNAKLNGYWVVFVFHDITADGQALQGTDDYDLQVGELEQIAAYAQQSAVATPNISAGLVTNPSGGNLVNNTGFDSPISSTADATTWNTTSPTNFTNDANGHGNLVGSMTSASLVSGATDTSLFSNTVAVTQKPYVIQAYLNIAAMLTGTQVTFQVDEYGAAGYMDTLTLLNTPNPAEPNPMVRSVGFEYTPTAGATSARLQVIAKGNSNLQAYLDSVTWFAEDGSTLSSNGDLTGDKRVDGADLGILLSNWNSTSATSAQGDLNGDKLVNGADLGILLSNWSK